MRARLRSEKAVQIASEKARVGVRANMVTAGGKCVLGEEKMPVVEKCFVALFAGYSMDVFDVADPQLDLSVSLEQMEVECAFVQFP